MKLNIPYTNPCNLLLPLVFIFSVLLACSSDSGSSGEDPQDTVTPYDPVAVTKTNNTKIYMHYMPWFETKASSANGQWGYHWTMANQNPDIVDGNGKRQIASHYYPLIGPYHSGDEAVIENHLLLMKYAGIDGILIDWYGTYDVNDFAMIKENTNQIIDLLDKVGLEYAIVYEDRFLEAIVNAGLAATAVNAAKTDMNYLRQNYFSDPHYIHINDAPLLLNFGPITLTTPQDWTNVFSVLSASPTFLTLWYESAEAGANAAGEFSWVYQDNSHISNFYNNQLPNLNVVMGSAYPGFHDFYAEGGTSTTIGWTIAHNNGATLDETLSFAASENLDYLQLVTWNDFGEGTMFEPTQEFGYSSIEKVKSFAGVQSLPSNSFNAISNLYNLRQTYSTSTSVQKQLDQVFYYLVSLQTQQAQDLLDTFN